MSLGPRTGRQSALVAVASGWAALFLALLGGAGPVGAAPGFDASVAAAIAGAHLAEPLVRTAPTSSD